MLPTQGSPLVAIEELVVGLESRLEDHLKVCQASSREKDTAIVSDWKCNYRTHNITLPQRSLRGELEQARNELSQITLEATKMHEMHLNMLRSTEGTLFDYCLY